MAELTDAQKVLRNDTGKRIAAAIEALGGTPQIDLGMTGASVGQVPVINTVDANGAPTSYRPGSGGGGGGGTSDYNDLSNKPSINGNTLSGNKTAAQLGLGTYSKPSGGIPKSDLASAVQTSLGLADSALQAVPSTYRTAAAQDAIDATDIIVVNIASYSGSQVRVPTSGTNAAITASHVLLYSNIGTPANQAGNWTVTTYDGYLTLSGSASGATIVQLVLGKAGTTI